MIRWIDSIDEVTGPETAWIWLARVGDPAAEAALRTAPATKDDLADAAASRTGDGGAGRLWRRRLARAMAARALGVPSEAIGFVRGTDGRPRIAAPRPLFVSTAAREGWSVVGVSPEPLGVDLEPQGADARRLWPRLSDARALERWLAAESWAKAHGRGLDEALRSAPVKASYRQRGGMIACALLAIPGLGNARLALT